MRCGSECALMTLLTIRAARCILAQPETLCSEGRTGRGSNREAPRKIVRLGFRVAELYRFRWRTGNTRDDSDVKDKIKKMISERNSLKLGTVLLLTLLAGFWWGKTRVAPYDKTSARMSQQETETPTIEPTLDPAEVYNPIYTSEDAVSRTLAELPQHFASNAITITRLVTEEHFWTWNGTFLPSPTAQSGLNDPIWVVGAISDGLKVSDVLFIFNESQRNDPIEGVYFAWQANTGFLLAQGVLVSHTSINLSTLDLLLDEQLAIQMPTAVPTLEPAPTHDPAANP